MGVQIASMAFALAGLLQLSACSDQRVPPPAADAAEIARGAAAIRRVGCGACHAIPGIWPKGTTGPSLAGFSARGTIAGRAPNRPDTLAAFLLDPAGSTMPRQPLTRVEAAEIAAFLHATD